MSRNVNAFLGQYAVVWKEGQYPCTCCCQLKFVKAAPKIDPKFVEPIKTMIEESPSFGYRTVAHLLGFNKNTVQRIFQLKGWQVKNRTIDFRPHIQTLPSVASAPNERWSTDLCRIWAGHENPG